MFIDWRSVRYFDWFSFFIILTLSGIGLLYVFSATYLPGQPYSIFFKKQAFGILSGIFIYILCSILDYRTLIRWGYCLYFIVIGLLIFTIIKGKIGMGAQRWIGLIFFRLQPSELAKLFFPAFATFHLFSYKNMTRITFKKCIPIIVILFFSFLLILKQPDLGTALIVLFSGIIMLWLVGINKRFFAYGFLLLFLTMPLSWNMLKSYQKKRVLVFLGYGEDKKERYQIEQSKIAIGSGSLCGKGFLQGTQNKLRFLPESRTDFIFSVICEEWGFCGAMIVIILYILLFLRQLLLVSSINNAFIQLLAIGLIIHIIFSTIINIGMVIGLLPIVGIPLPLMSYGLSNLWITFASFGWFNGLAMRRFYLSE